MTEDAASGTGSGEAQPGEAGGRRFLVIRNPTAGAARRWRLAWLLGALRWRGCEAVLRETAGPGDARRLAREAGPGVYDVIIAAGGDGTIAEVLNGLAERQDVRDGAGPALGIVPLGTANVLAGELALPDDTLGLLLYLTQGPVRRLRFGRLVGGPRFGAMVGAGFDAFVVAGVDLKVKRWIGKAAYGLAALSIWFQALPPLRVTVDGVTHEAGSVIVTKGRFYAGRFVVAPDARLDDECLHVCLFGSSGGFRRLVYGLAMALGKLPALRDYRVIAGQQVEIAGPDGAPLQGDGDIIGRLPAEIRLGETRVPVVFPRS